MELVAARPESILTHECNDFGTFSRINKAYAIATHGCDEFDRFYRVWLVHTSSIGSLGSVGLYEFSSLNKLEGCTRVQL